MDDDVTGVGATLSFEERETLRALGQIRNAVVTDVLARKRQVAACEVDIVEIRVALATLTDRVLRVLGERDLRDEELPA